MTLLKTTTLDCDILVAGGGLAGVCAALAAARNGVRVILCQDRPVLGGNASSEIRMHVVGANGTGHSERGEELVTEAREGGIIEELRLENAVRNPQRSSSMFDLILYDKCRTEPGLKLLLNTTVTGVNVENQTITSVLGVRHSTEEQFVIKAGTFVDCTGDGRLGAEAGAPFMEGRESGEAFGERYAPEVADSHRLGSTILIQARRHKQPMPYTAPGWVRTFTPEELKLRLYATPGDEAPTHEYGYWWAEWGGTRDTIGANEEIRDELLAITLGIWNHIKNGPPGTPAGKDPFRASNWALEWCGFIPGKRESRRFVGQHVLTEQDILTSRNFSDAIAYGGWSLDLHPPEGIDVPAEEPCVQHAVPHLYDIPLKACLARDLKNLMFAGRNISATHVGFSSTRVMATCAVMGQGVGTAAAYGIREKVFASQIPENKNLVTKIQQQLLRDDCYLIGKTNAEPADLALKARFRASSEQPAGKVKNLTSGQTRAVHGRRGAPTGRANAGSHRWMASPQAGLPAWVELKWSQPIHIAEIQLVFDTGLHRHLTLSLHNGYTASMKWGIPQPETIADYQLQISDEHENWKTILAITNNYQRRRVHQFGKMQETCSLRVWITKTNGLDHARIFEVRVYGSSAVTLPGPCIV